MIFVVLITYFLHNMKTKQLRSAISESSKTLIGAGFVLVFTVPMVRVLINSGVNDLGLTSMPVAMAEFAANSVGEIYPFICSYYRSFGSLYSR